MITTLQKLPDELKFKIVLFLPIDSIPAILQLNTTFYKTLSSNIFWKLLLERDYKNKNKFENYKEVYEILYNNSFSNYYKHDFIKLESNNKIAKICKKSKNYTAANVSHKKKIYTERYFYIKLKVWGNVSIGIASRKIPIKKFFEMGQKNTYSCGYIPYEGVFGCNGAYIYDYHTPIEDDQYFIEMLMDTKWNHIKYWIDDQELGWVYIPLEWNNLAFTVTLLFDESKVQILDLQPVPKNWEKDYRKRRILNYYGGVLNKVKIHEKDLKYFVDIID